ncbi:MAG: YfhO family protein, partial [Sediminibacterium sp.]
ILSNAPMLFSTYNYGKASIRGGSVLAKADGTKSTEGLSKAYALDYSMLKPEPLTLLFPNIYGGGSDPNNIDPAGSKAIEALQSMPQEVAQQLQGYIRFYWGGIGYTAGPPYIGFLFGLIALIGFGFKNIKHRYWMGAAIVLSLLLSYGLYFESFNVFMLDHLPFYNKFRAPSMIMVIPTLLLGMMAVLSAQEIVHKFEENKESFLQKIKPALYITGALFVLAFYFYATQNFKSISEADLIKQVQQIPDPNQRAAFEAPVASLVDGLAADRQAMFSSDLFKSLGLAAVLFVAIFLYYKKFISKTIFIIAVGFVALFDLFKVDLQYFNASNFSDPIEAEANFNPSPTDAALLKDTSYYRVLDLRGGIQAAFNGGALNSYFHHSVGGYHPAKLSIYQDLIENQWYNFPNCMPTANMLNTKYFIQGDINKDTIANPGALGNAWFVQRVSLQQDAAAVMKAITSFDPSSQAVVEKQDWKLDTVYAKDSLASIKLVRKQNDQMEYASTSSTKQLAVFSEIYYTYGWKAFIDDKETPIYKCNYVLRTIEVPAGSHTITFKFQPTEVILANKLGLGAVSLVWLLAIGSIVFYIRSKKD